MHEATELDVITKSLGRVATAPEDSAPISWGMRQIVLAAGGSATTDGGAGAIEALRVRGFPGLTAHKDDISGATPTSGSWGCAGDVVLVVLCDVTTRFEDAARVFGPQKGADAAAVGRLTERLERIAEELPR